MSHMSHSSNSYLAPSFGFTGARPHVSFLRLVRASSRAGEGPIHPSFGHDSKDHFEEMRCFPVLKWGWLKTCDPKKLRNEDPAILYQLVWCELQGNRVLTHLALVSTARSDCITPVNVVCSNSLRKWRRMFGDCPQNKGCRFLVEALQRCEQSFQVFWGGNGIRRY